MSGIIQSFSEMPWFLNLGFFACSLLVKNPVDHGEAGD